jgi:hypothetical protein
MEEEDDELYSDKYKHIIMASGGAQQQSNLPSLNKEGNKMFMDEYEDDYEDDFDV